MSTILIIICIILLSIYSILILKNKKILSKVLAYKIREKAPELLALIRPAAKPVAEKEGGAIRFEDLLQEFSTEVSLPKPRILKFFKMDPASITEYIERIDRDKTFFAQLVNWMIINLGEKITMKTLNITSRINLERAQEGIIGNPQIKYKLIEIFAKRYPETLIEFAKTYLPTALQKLIVAYVKGMIPREIKLCEKLRSLRIYSMAHIEMTKEYGPILRSAITPAQFTQLLVNNPAIVAEFFIVAKYATSIETEFGTKIFIKRTIIKGNDSIILIETNPNVNLTVIKQILKRLPDAMNSIEIDPVDLLIEAMKKILVG